MALTDYVIMPGVDYQALVDKIKEKTGKTEPLVSGQLAAELDNISGGGSSGGGGTLSTGVYLSASDIKNPTNYRHRRFMFNGTLYASASNLAGAGYLNVLYRWNGTAWEQLLKSSSSTAGINNINIDSVGWKCAEYKGKLHMIDAKLHAVFDGTNITKSTDLPNSDCTICVCNGKLYVYSNTYSCKSLYEWDDANNAWNTVATSSSTLGNMITYGGQLYFASGTTVTKYVNGTFTTWGTAPEFINDYICVGDEMYCYYNNFATGLIMWYKVNLETMEYTELGKQPRFNSMFFTGNADELSFVGTAYSSNSYHPFFVVNIIEATE